MAVCLGRARCTGTSEGAPNLRGSWRGALGPHGLVAAPREEAGVPVPSPLLPRAVPAPFPALGLLFQRPRGSGSGTPGPDAPAMSSSPVSRVVYNGRRNSSPRSPSSSSEIFTPAHEENVRFIYEAWQGVERDLRSRLAGSERGLVEEYVEKVPNPSLKSFKPIDLSDLKRRSTPDTKKS